MRKLLLATVALAALTGSAFAGDLPSRKEAPVYVAPVAAYSWTGFYLGAEGGAQMPNIKGDWFSNHQTLGMIGGLVGYNYQVSPWFVIGLEANGGGLFGSKYTGNNASALYPNAVTTDSWYADIRGRLGYAMDRALLYVAGGVAFGNADVTYTYPTVLPNLVNNNSLTGWTIGGGLEYAFTNNWIGRAEYRYTDLGKKTFTYANVYTDSVSATSSAALVGVIYKFGAPAAPVVAKY